MLKRVLFWRTFVARIKGSLPNQSSGSCPHFPKAGSSLQRGHCGKKKLRTSNKNLLLAQEAEGRIRGGIPGESTSLPSYGSFGTWNSMICAISHPPVLSERSPKARPDLQPGRRICTEAGSLPCALRRPFFCFLS